MLEWNKAFERIGFRDALVVKQQSDDADWNTLDARHASIRWYVGADAGTARGPHHSDPRTGEILDADIAMADVFTRSARRFFVEQGTRSAAAAETGRPGAADEHAHEPAADDCHYAMEAAAELDFALEVLAARGDIDPDGPEAEAFVQAVVKDTIMHEVGHTLGLKHNFKASTTVQREALLDRTRTQRDGTSGSVMDYNPFNLALPGEPQGAYINTTLGPYDYWAIEYAYRPLPAEREEEELLRIASRSTEPALAFGDDYDAGGFGGFEGIDPTANRFDLGDDPLAYAQKRLRLTQELWQRVQSRPPPGGTRCASGASCSAASGSSIAPSSSPASTSAAWCRCATCPARRGAPTRRWSRRASGRPCGCSRATSSRPTASGSGRSFCAACRRTTWTAMPKGR